MQEKENFKFRIEIGDYSTITFKDFTKIIGNLNTFVRSCNLELIKRSDFVKDEDYETALRENEAKIVEVGNGSVWIDIVIPIACSLIPFAYEVIKDIVALYKEKHIKIDDYDRITKVDKRFKDIKLSWSLDDNILFTERCINTYCRKNRNILPDNFVDSLPFSFQKFGHDSLLLKVRNTKALFNKYKINNNLDISPFNHYSKEHEKVFKELLGL